MNISVISYTVVNYSKKIISYKFPITSQIEQNILTLNVYHKLFLTKIKAYNFKTIHDDFYKQDIFYSIFCAFSSFKNEAIIYQITQKYLNTNIYFLYKFKDNNHFISYCGEFYTDDIYCDTKNIIKSKEYKEFIIRYYNTFKNIFQISNKVTSFGLELI